MPRGGRDHAWAAVETSSWNNGPRLNRYGCSPPPCRTLADMTLPEIRAIEREYGMPVLRPTKHR